MSAQNDLPCWTLRALLGKGSPQHSFAAGPEMPAGSDDAMGVIAEPLGASSPAPATPDTLARSRAFQWGGAKARDAFEGSMEEKMKTLQERVRGGCSAWVPVQRFRCLTHGMAWLGLA